MSNLNISFCGLHAENPFFLASAPPTASYESICSAFTMGWGGAAIKTISSSAGEMFDVSNRFTVLDDKTKYAFQNIELLSKLPLANWLRDIKRIKADFPNKILIGNIMATNISDWQQLAKSIQEAGVDALELNFSCPNGMPDRGLGQAIGQNPTTVHELTSAVKAVATIPVFVKLTPNVTNIAYIAEVAQNAGADGITAINTVQSILSVDLDNFVPRPNIGGQSVYGGMSGRAIKPIGLRCVSQISMATQLPVLGVGGISTWQDAMEYILLGASATQVCTQVMLNGMEIIKPLLEGTSKYLQDKNIANLGHLVGKANANIIEHNALSRKKLQAHINQDKCVRCNKCLTICSQSARQAIQKLDDRFVVSHACDGCSLCEKVCAARAISMLAD